MDISILLTPDAIISLITLTFLEIVLGVDNIVFITLTTNRLAKNKQALGRKLGLAGAFISRCIFLCFASFLVTMTNSLFTISLFGIDHGVSLRDIIMFAGGIYLIYKGGSELRSVLSLEEEKANYAKENKTIDENMQKPTKQIGLIQAIATIMIMDVVFSIDSVITAVGIADYLIVMILAVLIAIIIMMIFIDTISNFINSHAEMKVLALVFITTIGILLILDGLQISCGIELLGMSLEKILVYFAMIFSFILEVIQMRYKGNLKRWMKERDTKQ